MNQVLRHLQPNKTSADNHGTFHRLLIQVLFDTVGIGYVTKRKDAFRVDALQRGTYGRGARREQQFIITFRVHLPVGGTHGHFFPFPVDSGHLRKRAHINVKTLPERFGRLHEQAVALLDNTTYIIR